MPVAAPPGNLVKKLLRKGAVLSLLLQHRHEFSRDPVLVQKGASRVFLEGSL